MIMQATILTFTAIRCMKIDKLISLFPIIQDTTAMKRISCTLLLFLILLVFACGGTSVKKTPGASHDGMKELGKGIGWYQKGCYHKSLEHFNRANELFAASDHLSGIAMAMNNIGNVYRLMGDAKSARLFFDEAYTIYSDLNQPEGSVQALANKAALLIDGDTFEEAETVIQQAESISKASGIVSISLLNNKGVLLTKKKDFTAAENVLMQALSIATPESSRTIATVNASLGNLHTERGDYEQALQYLNNALEIDRLENFRIGLADDLAAIGTVYYLQNRYDLALKNFQRSIKIHALYGNQEKVKDIKEVMEDAAEKAGIDIRVTTHFVDKWVAGEVMESPCK
jgi:tetratricopeptide (TPR) repeat protein